MNVDLLPGDRQFEAQVRDFLADKFTPELRAAAARQAGVFAEGELSRLWHRILFDQGWIAPSWPAEYGGTGWSAMQRYIFDRDCGLAGTPMLPAMGLTMCGPVIMRYGDSAQKDYFLPRILSGEHYWCQGYSETGAGSDLASLQMSAVRDGEDYVVNGSKIWTTHAHQANWMFLLVRTANEGRPQSGITFLLTPMDVAGLTVTPIRSMSGEHEVNQCFFDNVRIPLTNRVGEENNGWTIAKYLLEFERGGGSAAGRLRASFNRLGHVVSQEYVEDGIPLSSDAVFQDRMMRLESRILAIDWTERRLVAARPVGGRAGEANASMMKLLVSELTQDIAELTLEALGNRAAIDQHRALGMHPMEPGSGGQHTLLPAATYLNARATTIFGGSSEIQKNIIAKIALNL
jgi:acyl-CoA dehydrogenase